MFPSARDSKNPPTRILGLDIGGTHITCGVVENTDGNLKVLSHVRRPVDAAASMDRIFEDWCNAINEVADLGRTDAIGIAMPGPCDYSNGTCLIRGLDKFESLYGTNIPEQLRKGLNLETNIPIVMENDCNAFALAEAVLGGGRNGNRIIAITLGTGFGSGFVVDRRIIHDGPGIPPDATFGFVPYRAGIAEDYISRRGLRRLFVEHGGDKNADVIDIARAAEGGDQNAKMLFERLGEMLADVLAPFVEDFGADTLVIGGAIAGSFNRYAPRLQDRIGSNLSIRRSELGDTAGLLGATLILLSGSP